MLSATDFHEIVSRRRKGIVAATCRSLLAIAELPYSLAVRWRNRRFDRGQSVVQARVPIISVGNLTVGGTGKTPMVAWLARWYRQKGVRVSLISRGYRAEAGGLNDEALELEQQLPDVPHLQNPDRVAAAEVAVEELETQLILLDDAFQHRRIARQLDLVLIDALEPFGYGHMLPRGLLREPLTSLRRADLLVVTRANLIDEGERSKLIDQLRQRAPDTPVIAASHQPQSLVSSSNQVRHLSELEEIPVFAFCGIGNPAAFRKTLLDCGARLAGFRQFPDHHAYHPPDIEILENLSHAAGSKALVCTCKDLVKIQTDRIGDLPVWGLAVEMEILCGKEILEEKLLDVLAECE